MNERNKIENYCRDQKPVFGLQSQLAGLYFYYIFFVHRTTLEQLSSISPSIKMRMLCVLSSVVWFFYDPDVCKLII